MNKRKDMSSEIAEMKLTDHYFENLIPQNGNFKSQLIASDKNQSFWHFTQEWPYKYTEGCGSPDKIDL